jgi:hypothetical protein
MQQVRRVEYPGGGHIEPAMDQAWSDLEKLRWKLAVSLLDSDANPLEWYIHGGRDGEYVEYDLTFPRGIIGPFDFRGMWAFLTGLELGLNRG